ncbi:Putative carbohydrate metabolism domain-containing protein [Fibrobacter sp. UWB15]|uniref:PCMD domain-containing protein n=1 Tax=unclassified Fibrobacter TaxID=2634177 RepID=UPI0009173BB0|nr:MULTISPECIES: PCMD domain-containing protein [unclassified Fibrobacter]PWJ68007.1 putative glycosyl hydrolase or carbohydrate binding protein [Fibrobacter sp. UWB6]SHF84313.1 Putative carbohydrate metabolism domain-containing protein [Fibrobacter sp. UWB8]SMG17238.1 Putative carbohydrate metabolism domain-containing protein [Fibrobacter sp. UWB15]
MKKWNFLALMMLLGACTADYDTFNTSDYRELKEIVVAEQDGSPAIYSEQHRIEFDLVEVPDSLDTWESVTLEELDLSHFATLHLVDGDIDDFPTDSAGLDSLANKVKYSKNAIEQGETLQIPSSHVLYVVVVSESGKKSVWQLKFNIPNVEPESGSESSSSSAKSSSSAERKSSSSEKSDKSSSSESKETSSSSQKSADSSAATSSSSESDEPTSSSEGSAEAPKILSLSIAGKAAVIDEENKSIHVDDLEFRTDLTALELSAMELSEGATANVTVGESYDFGAGIQVKVTNEDESVTYSVKAGYQLPGENFNSWNKNDVTPDSIWGNANTILTTTEKKTSGSMIGAMIKTGSALTKIASGSLYTADFNPNGVGTLSMASSSTWPDGNELLDFGKPFAARPEYMEVKFSYEGKGDSCDIYILLENRTGNKNVNRKSTDVNTLVASAWFRSTKADNSGRENPDVVSVSEPDENGMRTLRLKLKYGEPLEGSPIENSSTFDTKLKSSNKAAINNGLVQGTGEEPVTHIRVVFASSADGNHYKGVSGATLIVDDLKLIY